MPIAVSDTALGQAYARADAGIPVAANGFMAATVPVPVPTAAGEPGRTDAAHEDRCRRCGTGCHVSIESRGRDIVVPGLHCRFLATDGPGRFTCTVYADRFTHAPWCHHADVAAPLGYLADDCPYGIPGVKGKTRLPEPELARYWPDLLRKMRSWGVPVFISHEAVLAEVERREGVPYLLEPWPKDAERLRLRPVHAVRPEKVPGGAGHGGKR